MVPSSAVPDSPMLHGETGRLEDVAAPLAFHATVVPLRAPEAVPANATPLQFALNAPDAVVAVIDVAFQWKSVQVFGLGMMLLASFTDCHDPASESIEDVPVEVGPVTEVLCSKPTQPAAAIDTTATNARM